MSLVAPQSRPTPCHLTYLLFGGKHSPAVTFWGQNCSFRMSVLKVPSQTMGTGQGVRTRISVPLHHERATGQHVGWQGGTHVGPVLSTPAPIPLSLSSQGPWADCPSRTCLLQETNGMQTCAHHYQPLPNPGGCWAPEWEPGFAPRGGRLPGKDRVPLTPLHKGTGNRKCPTGEGQRVSCGSELRSQKIPSWGLWRS